MKMRIMRGRWNVKRIAAVLLVAVLVASIVVVPDPALARGGYGYGGGHGYYGGHRGGGFGWGSAFKFALAAAVVGTAVDMARGGYGYGYPPVYYHPAPVCGWVPGQPMFDAYGRYMGTSPPVWVCQQPY